MTSWFKGHAPEVLIGLLLLQVACFYGFAFGEHQPQPRPLVHFALASTDWSYIGEQTLDKPTLDVLNADETMYRAYENENTHRVVTLFVAYFASQRTGKTPHSPKNCLPGTGWVPTQSGTVQIPVSGRSTPITINRYIVARGQAQDVVLYWYQARHRVIASEYDAKFFTILDSLRYRRSDMSLIRVVSPSVDGNIADAASVAESFVKGIFPPLEAYLPA